MNRAYFKQDSEFGTSIWFEENGRRISFPEAPGNRHYDEYLLWLAEGNEPEVVQPEVIND